MKKLLAIIAAVLVISVFGLGQGTKKEYALKKVERQLFGDEQKCGDYFYTTTFGRGGEPWVIYYYSDKETRSDNVKKSRINVEIKEVNPPLVERNEGPGLETVLFKMIRPVYESSSSCLPSPVER